MAILRETVSITLRSVFGIVSIGSDPSPRVVLLTLDWTGTRNNWYLGAAVVEGRSKGGFPRGIDERIRHGSFGIRRGPSPQPCRVERPPYVCVNPQALHSVSEKLRAHAQRS